jgi:hypothetical protein
MKSVRLFLHLFYTNKSHWLLVTLLTSLLHVLLVDPRSDSLDHTNQGDYRLVENTKIGSNFALFGLLSKGAVWRQF